MVFQAPGQLFGVVALALSAALIDIFVGSALRRATY